MDSLARLVSPARKPAAEPLMLLLLHGLGSNEADLFALAPELDPRLTVVCLRAPYPYAIGGYAWFDVQWTQSSLSFDGRQAVETRDRLVRNLTSLQNELGVSPRGTILGGFSQGAMMTLGVMLNRPDLIGGAMLLSGCLVPDLVPSEPSVDIPVFQSHGAFDPVLPIGLGRIMRDLLNRAEAPLEYHEYPMGHEVSLATLQDAQSWLEEWVESVPA